MPVTGPGLPGRAVLEARRIAKLRDLLCLIARDNPFYAKKLDGVDLGFDTLETFSRRVPFTRKQELTDDQHLHPPFGTNLTYPQQRYSRFSQTSATTGKPMRWLDTEESWNWMIGNWTKVFESAGVTPEDRCFFAFSFGPFLGFWVAFDCAHRLGCLAIPGGGMRSATRLDAILDSGATVLCCTPTYAIRLAEVAAEEGIDLGAAKVRTVIVAGEPGGSVPGTRRHIEQLWNGARVVDHHGMTEIGPVSYGCPQIPGVLHVIESEFVAEIVDPAGDLPVAPGASGELVLTNLGRVGSPLIRYRTGDIVQAAGGERCLCGSSDLALAGGILGRTDDMVVVRGVNVYPAAIEDAMRSCGGVAEYRVSIRTNRTLTEMNVEVEPAPEHADDPAMVHRIETALRNALSLRIPVTLVACGTLPRFELKARRWLKTQ